MTATADWSILEIEGITETAYNAATRVHRQYHGTSDLEDLKQEALILLASKHVEMREAADDFGLARVHHKLVQDLTDSLKTEAKHRSSHVSYESLIEQAVDGE